MKYEKLFEPISFGMLTAKNRIESSPSLPCTATIDGEVTRDLIEYYKAKAKGGAGIVTVGESAIDRDYAVSHAGMLVIDSDRMIPGLSALAEAIKRYGALASLELCHAGRQTIPWLIDGKNPVGPSSIPSAFHEAISGQKIAVDVLTQDLIDQIIENFADAALRLKLAGFDMTLIHGGHGWLLAQFLSPYSNKRTDKYGGSLENRVRFVLEVLTRIREKCGPEFGIEFRMSAIEYIEGGLSQEESIAIAKLIEDKVDLFHVSAGMMGHLEDVPRTHPTIYEPNGRNVHFAAAIKKAVNKPVTCVGGITTPQMMEDILKEGSADIVAMTRSIIADPSMPNKLKAGKEEDIVPCIRCLHCLGRVANFYPVRCAVNPHIGREVEFPEIRKAETKKKVVIVGGGPAGMEAADIACQRGHDVTLFEKTDRLGGNLVTASSESFKNDMKRYLGYLVRKTSRLPIVIKYGTEATEESIKAQKPDAMILAVGSDPIVPGIPGIDNSNTIFADDLLRYPDNVKVPGERVTVIGGGLVGCEVALSLALEGKKVTVVEMLDEVCKEEIPVNRISLLYHLGKQNVELKTGCKVVEIGTTCIQAVDSDNNSISIASDSVVMALGYKPRTDLIEKLKGLAPEVHIVGDCKSPRKIAAAVEEGFFAAVEL